MRVAEINTVTNGSTGRIMLGIAETARQSGIEVKTYAKKWSAQKEIKGNKYFGTKAENRLNAIISRITGFADIYSVFGTKKLINELDKWNVDCIHLHNIHGWYISFPLLFKYIKSKNISVVWTLHDCWPFTGKCPYFSYPKCEKWQSGCGKCKRLKDYPSSIFDTTKYMYKLKRKCFSGVRSMRLVTPSVWLSELVKQSYLNEYEVKIINNGIDLDVFYPRKRTYFTNVGIENKKIILGVAFEWEKRKGLDVFLWLSKCLSDDYRIVLVGTNDAIDKLLPNNIISIHKTHDQDELAQIYSSADVFINPTREDNFPTTNIESLACGTPVVTFNTGGSPEMLSYACGAVVETEDLEGLKKQIERLCNNSSELREKCRKQAENYNMTNCFKKYVDLYFLSVR